MKKFIVIFLIVLLASFSFSQDDSSVFDAQSLNEYFQEIENSTTDETLFYRYFYSKLGDANRDCVKEKLNLSQNGDKVVARNYCQFFVITSFWLCTPNPSELANKVIDMYIDLVPSKFEKYLDCAKNSLKQIDADEALVSDFDSETFLKSEENLKKCADKKYGLFNEDMKENYDEFEFNGISCGSIELSDLQKFHHKFLIIKFTKDEVIRNAEIKQMIKIGLEKIQKINTCISGKV